MPLNRLMISGSSFPGVVIVQLQKLDRVLPNGRRVWTQEEGKFVDMVDLHGVSAGSITFMEALDHKHEAQIERMHRAAEEQSCEHVWVTDSKTWLIDVCAVCGAERA